MLETVWNAWQEAPLRLDWPAEWPLESYSLPPAPGLSEAQQAEALDAALPEALAVARARAGQLRSACVLVDDHTRPAAWGPLLGHLLGRLRAILPPENITVLVSLAGHAPMTPEELRWKLGALPPGILLRQHDPGAPLVWLEIGGKPVGIDAGYAQASFKAAFGTLIPHPFAGFSGGAKAVMPGIADLETVRRNHGLVAFGRGKVADPANDIRRQMEDIAGVAGLDLLVNAAVNGNREMVRIFAGPWREAYAEGVEWARRWSACPARRPHDTVLLNAYPKDREMLQVSNAFNVLRTLAPGQLAAVRDVVLIARAAGGLGYHALFGPGGPLYRKPAAPRWMAHARLLVYAPELPREAVEQSVGGELCTGWAEVLERLGAGSLRRDAGLWHQASLQTAETLA